FQLNCTKNDPANHRYSMPGESAVYGSSGERTKAWETVIAEVGYPIGDQVLKSVHVKWDKVLDLTDPSVRQRLDIEYDSLIEDMGQIESAYDLTHSIGAVARDLGYVGIRAPSA